MNSVADFAAKQKDYADKMHVALSGLQGDVKHLTDRVRELQQSPGQITESDQELLDDIDASSKSLVAKFQALDNLTPPKL